jgi:hypothetical protein
MPGFGIPFFSQERLFYWNSLDNLSNPSTVDTNPYQASFKTTCERIRAMEIVIYALVVVGKHCLKVPG